MGVSFHRHTLNASDKTLPPRPHSAFAAARKLLVPVVLRFTKQNRFGTTGAMAHGRGINDVDR
jgi:hypothetical protein